jgi:hypothetical protein
MTRDKMSQPLVACSLGLVACSFFYFLEKDQYRTSKIRFEPLRVLGSLLLARSNDRRMGGFFKGTITPNLDILIASKCLTIHR